MRKCLKEKKKNLTNRKRCKVFHFYLHKIERKIFINVIFFSFFSISFFSSYFPFSFNRLCVIYFLFFLDIHQSFALLKQSRKLILTVFLFPIIIISTKEKYISKAKCQLIEHLILLHQ